jgi:membrane protein required for colicin V production
MASVVRPSLNACAAVKVASIGTLTNWVTENRMNFIDYLILIVLLISVFLGFFRGFFAEAISLICWLGGLWLAWHYAYLVEPHLGGLLAKAPFNTWAARTILLVAVLVTGWLVTGVLSYFAHQSGISLMLDRLLGVLFGCIRGVVLISITVMLAKQVQLDRTDWWQKSRFMPMAAEVASWIKGFADSAVSIHRQDQSDTTAEV